jgi:hypothetical protein
MLRKALIGWLVLFGLMVVANEVRAEPGLRVSVGDLVRINAPACIAEADAVAVAAKIEGEGFDAANALFSELAAELDPASNKSRCATVNGPVQIGEWVAAFTDSDGDVWNVFEVQFPAPPYKAFALAPVDHTGRGQEL